MIVVWNLHYNKSIGLTYAWRPENSDQIIIVRINMPLIYQII